MNEELTQVQDQPKFVCKTVLDVNYQNEATKAIVGKSQLGSSLVMFGLIFIVGFYYLLDSIMNQAWQKNSFMLILSLAMLGFAVYSRLTMPKKITEQWETAIEKKYGSKSLHLTTEFYARSLAQSIQENEDEIDFDGYSSITELKETEHLYLLRHGKNKYYFVDKKGFTVGDPKEFRSFIEQCMGGK